jgi:hypothetical protein
VTAGTAASVSSVTTSSNYQWREIPDATRFGEKPGSDEVSFALSRLVDGGAYECCSGQDLLQSYGTTTYVVFHCKCGGSIRIKAALQASCKEWCLFANHGGVHSSNMSTTTTVPVLSTVYKQFLKKLVVEKPSLSQSDALDSLLFEKVGL